MVNGNIKIQNIGVTKIGDSHYIRVPADFINHGDVDPSKKYDLILKEVSEDVA